MTSGDPPPLQPEPSGPSLRLVLGIVVLVAVALSVVMAGQYRSTQQHLTEVMARMDRIGPDLDTQGCVTAVLEWHADCEAMQPICDEEVARVLAHCLLGRDRAQTCQSLDLGSVQAQWVWDQCVDRGTPCVSRKKCACANAYRAIDSFCRHGQRGVSL